MIMGSVVSGSLSNGLNGFVKGSDFSCNASICFAAQRPGTVDTAFKNLQRAINRWAGKAKFTPISVDGFIGAGTVSALSKAGTASLESLPNLLRQAAQTIFSNSLSKENVAANAAGLTEQLNTSADRLESGGQLPSSPQIPTPPSAPNASVGPSFPDVPQVPTPPAGGAGPALKPPITLPETVVNVGPPAAGKSNMLWWILGGVAAVATAGVVTVVVLRRKKKAPSRSMSYRPGRRSTAAHTTN